jgi:hypothetical protein
VTRLGAILVAAALLAGCGGGGDDGNGAKIETKADFIAAADKICVARDARSRDLTKEAGTDIGRLSRELAETYEDSIAKIEALALPPGAARAGAAKYVQSVSAMRKPVQRMKTSAADVEQADDVAELKAAGAQLQVNVNTVQAIGDVADQNARQYGMKSCGQQQALPVT